MQVPVSLFKAYDIRGVVPVSLNTDTARALGRAFGTHAFSQGEQVVAVGRDGRLSGLDLQQASIRP
jgi:phosphomannomutase